MTGHLRPLPVDYGRAVDDLRAQLGRVDTKALGLSAINLGALGLYGSVALRADVPLAVRGGAVAGAAVVLWSLRQLISAVQPNLGGNHGFARYARAASREQLDDAVLADQADPGGETQWLSRVVEAKYQVVRRAVRLLKHSPEVAVVVGAVTAAVHDLTR